MKQYLTSFSMILVAVALIGLTGIPGLAVPRPFHLVEHGNLTATPRDSSGNTIDLVANGTGTATHLGFITVHREAVLTAKTPGGVVFDFNGSAILTAANGEQLFTTITGTVDFSTGHANLIYEWSGGTPGTKFENATGTTIWSVDVANGEYDAVAVGEIVLD